MPASKIIRKAIRNNKDNKKVEGASRPPLGFVVFDISDCFSDDFACRHVVFLGNLGPWALGAKRLNSERGVRGAAAPGWLKEMLQIARGVEAHRTFRQA